ncbi:MULTISPECIES: hypothetical protein [Agrobacterium tumefaciens complex]|uniref:Transmembrane protein n=1 Tax=Agrobacterium burrii TaxID=2815339 RepID=A0ABS3EGZ4_9HYPH|nr:MULTISPECIES: hypothetical protein [Agrobacterium tumefaciens complex]MBO0131239.1 hypothetical protein [Agrobacterium burrii]NTZ90998.1 hypothetical protein [Agrobacterium tumefaciens]
MSDFRNSLFFPITLLICGVAAFFLFLYVTGHDPDERPLTLVEWIIGGMLIGPGFGYLLRWRKIRNSRGASPD